MALPAGGGTAPEHHDGTGAASPEDPIPPVIECDHMMLACKAIDNPRVENVEKRAPRVEKDQRNGCRPRSGGEPGLG